MLLEVEHLDTDVTLKTLSLLLKHRGDLELAAKELALENG